MNQPFALRGKRATSLRGIPSESRCPGPVISGSRPNGQHSLRRPAQGGSYQATAPSVPFYSQSSSSVPSLHQPNAFPFQTPGSVQPSEFESPSSAPSSPSLSRDSKPWQPPPPYSFQDSRPMAPPPSYDEVLQSIRAAKTNGK